MASTKTIVSSDEESDVNDSQGGIEFCPVGVGIRNKHPNPNQNAIADDDDDDDDDDYSIVPLGDGYFCDEEECNQLENWYMCCITGIPAVGMPRSTEKWISYIIDNHKVAIFSKSECPVCETTIALLKEMVVEEDVVVLELDMMRTSDGFDFTNELFNRTAQTSFPNVFVMQQHIGDNDDTQAAKSNGQLENLLGIYRKYIKSTT
jgi:glutaredoxin 3